MVELNPADFKIINYLLEKEDADYKEMAKALDIPLSTVYDRIKALKEKGIIKGAFVDFDLDKIGYKIMSLIEITFHDQKFKYELKKQLCLHKNVIGVLEVIGNYDMIALTKFKDPQELEPFIKELLSHKEIKNVDSNMVIMTDKFKLNPFPVEP
ncbi:MAG: Lrp/AsnC family transcriptional regulator [Candidatus Diapherotrites archaeon]